MAMVDYAKRKRTGNKRTRLLQKWGGWSAVLILGVTFFFFFFNERRLGQAVPAAGAKVSGLTSVLTRSTEGLAVPLSFEDATVAFGLDFHHMPTPRRSLLPEDMGSGVACGDYDEDGFVDVLLVNFSGNALPGAPLIDSAHTRLYRNIEGRRFEDVTLSAGVGFVGLGMGAAWGDYDGDGDLDLYITAYGDNVLYRNLGDGSFEEATHQAGVQDSRFSTGCSWADYDRDGDLDLYVCNYVDFQYKAEYRDAHKAQYATEQPYTLNPSSYAPQRNALFRNRGDGTFEEVAKRAGVDNPGGRSLSASWVDLNGDGWVDLYVANDVSNNGVFLNNRDGTFTDIGASSLAADYRGAMGIAVADLDNDLDQDLLITHWLAQENALYRNMLTDAVLGDSASPWFMDQAEEFGLGQISIDMVGWATAFGDLDNDGLRDLWIVNGSTIEQADDHSLLEMQPTLLFWNRGSSGFVEVAAQACPQLAAPRVGRGGAQADFNADGLLDLVIVTHGGRAMLLLNTSTPSGHFLRLELRQTSGNTRALGARAYVTTAVRTLMGEVGCSSSYLSQDETTLHFGLGDARGVEVLRIVWPDGAEETHEDVEIDRTLTFVHDPRYE
ncbi:MAG: CRTAC1 family protein [Planctomycetes bacterium]|nr:CRTAC1 family protein [Planctomycetota bacterium]